MGVSNLISSLRSNILGAGGSSGPSSLPPKRTPIELTQDQGPLAKLKKDPLGFSTLSYPRDLVNNSEVGHYMLFYINQQNNTTFDYTDVRGFDVKGRTITNETKTTTTELPGLNSFTETKLTGEEIISGGGMVEGSYEQYDDYRAVVDASDVARLRQSKRNVRSGAMGQLDNLGLGTKRIQDSIAIYLPPNVKDTYTTTYSPMATGLIGFSVAAGIDIAGAIKNNDMRALVKRGLSTAEGIFEEMGKRAGLGIIQALTESEGGIELVNKVFGRAANPYLEVLFQGPELRTFSYDFTFAPRNELEQEEVKKIIQLFRFHQAPEQRSDHSLFLGLPSEFDIHYMYQPSSPQGVDSAGIAQGGGMEAYENPFYNKIATCVLQSVNVDYTPGKVASHQQGAPVLIKMSLSFMETEMITKKHVELGY